MKAVHASWGDTDGELKMFTVSKFAGIAFSLSAVLTLAAQQQLLETSVDGTTSSGGEAVKDPTTVLAYRPFVKTIENFLTQEECEHMIELTMNLPGYDESKYTNTLYFDRVQGQYKDPLLHKIENKVAALLGWPDHPDQESLCVHRIAEDSEAESRIINIHHDKANKPWTTATLIVYLDDVEDGGETIFPCTSSPEVRQACQRAYSQGARWYNGERTVLEGEIHWEGQDHSGEVSTVDDTLSFLKSSTSDLCSQRNQTGSRQRVLSVKPRRGMAALFHHDLPGGL